MPVVPKSAWLCQWYQSNKRNFQKIFERKKLIKIQPTTLLQIFCELMINSKVIFKITRQQESRKSPSMNELTLPMLRLLLPKAKGCKDFWKPAKPCHIGNLSLSTLRWVPMSQGFSRFSGFLHHSILAKLATSSMRVILCIFQEINMFNVVTYVLVSSFAGLVQI